MFKMFCDKCGEETHEDYNEHEAIHTFNFTDANGFNCEVTVSKIEKQTIPPHLCKACAETFAAVALAKAVEDQQKPQFEDTDMNPAYEGYS